MFSRNLFDLEKSVDTANQTLDNLSIKLINVEKNLDVTDNIDTEDNEDNDCVMQLLESVTEVKNEYQNLRKDLKEVQQLQKEMSTSLRYQMQSMTQTFNILKKKIEANAQQQLQPANTAAVTKQF